MENINGKSMRDDSALSRSWKIATYSSILGLAYFNICIFGVARVKFLTELGASARHFGIIMCLGALCLGFQLIGGVLARRLAHKKPIWIFLTIAGRMFFLGVLVAPFIFAKDSGISLRIGWIIVMLFLHDGLCQLGAPIWFAWMADIVPEESFNRKWASRQKVSTIAGIASQLLIVLVFGYFESRSMVITGFVILGGFGAIAGMIEIMTYKFVHEPSSQADKSQKLLKTMTEPLADTNYRGFLYFNGTFFFSVALFGCFFSVYLVQHVGISAWMIQSMMMVGALGTVVSSGFWGVLTDIYGKRPVIETTMAVKLILPAIMVFVPYSSAFYVPALFAGFAIDGVGNAGLFLTLNSYMMQQAPRKSRAMYVAVTNFISNGLIVALASLGAGYFIDAFKTAGISFGRVNINSYQFVFIAAIALRMFSIFLAGRLKEVKTVPAKTMVSQLMVGNPFQVVGAIHRLSESPKPGKRARAARLLGNIKSHTAVTELQRSLTDDSRCVRKAAADALGKIGSQQAKDSVTAVLNGQDHELWPTAVTALGRIGDRNSLGVLIESLAKPNEKTQEKAVKAIAKIGDNSAENALKDLYAKAISDRLRTKIVWALNTINARPLAG